MEDNLNRIQYVILNIMKKRKAVDHMVDRAIANCKVDRTYRTFIKRIDKNGYVIIDQTGQERTVPCGIPNVELRPMQSVYVKEPMGNLKELHICSVVGNTSNSSNRSRR